MISNIIKHPNSSGMINYNENKVNEKKAELIHSNFFSTSAQDKIDHFESVALTNQAVKKNKFSHITISFPKGEFISNEQAIIIFSEYLQLMNYSNVPVLIYRHNDTDLNHFHIVTSTIDYNMKQIEYWNDHYLNMSVGRYLEKKHDLKITKYIKKNNNKKLGEINLAKYSILKGISKVQNNNKKSNIQLINLGVPQTKLDHIKSKKLDNTAIKKKLSLLEFNKLTNTLKKHNLLELSKKQKLINKLDLILSVSKSPREYQTLLKEKGIYFTTLSKENNKYIKYGDKETGFYITDKKLPERFKYGTINKTKQPSYNVLQQKQYISKLANRALYNSKTLDQFIGQLSKYNIGIQFSNNKGGIYGVSFFSLSEKNPQIFKGSEFSGKRLSWNTIKSKLDITNETKKKSPSTNQKRKRKLIGENKTPSLNKLSRSLDTSYDEQAAEKSLRRRKKRDKDQESEQKL